MEVDVAVDPREVGPKPPFPKQHQEFPGVESAMTPRPDHGEESYVGHDRLAGRTALVVGGDSGIGKAVAIAYAREGADVAVGYLNEHEDAQDTVSWIERAGRRGLAMAGDIGEEDHSRDLVRRTVAQLGKLDILVITAVFGMNHPTITEVPSAEWRHAMTTNLDGMFYLCKAAVPYMQPGSAIITTSSIEAYKPDPNALAYSTTKGAIVTFSMALGQDVIRQGIRVNCVAPGPFWTPLTTVTMEPEKTADYGHQTPLKRPGQPKEIAPIYVLLASDEGSFVADTMYLVAGGMPLP
jgi:NAD(P)-dependent dehydrogenase (short-subunit alcohol dehydrogenase family)